LRTLRLFYSLLIIFCFAGCFRASISADLGELYNRSARQDALTRNPLIVIPGVLGSNLVDSKSDRSIWGAWDGEFANPKREEDSRLIALPVDPGVSPANLEDSVVSAGALDRIRLRILGFPVGFRAYAQLLVTLGAGGYRDESLGTTSGNGVDYGDEHFTCFQFDYDWRKSNSANAARLDNFIEEKKKYIKSEYRKRFNLDPGEIKFDVVAHSMGGLLARYYLRYGDQELGLEGPLPALTWAGAKNIENLITVGTPNSGALVSIQSILKGRKDSIFLPYFSPTLMGSFPSLYELMPRNSDTPVVEESTGQALDIYNVETWDRFSWGLLSSDDELKTLLPSVDSANQRHQIAKEQLSRLLLHAKRFHRALDKPADLPEELSIYLFTGDAEKTPDMASVNQNGKLNIVRYSPGDAIVSRRSALGDQRNPEIWKPKLESPVEWTGVYFIFKDHLGLIQDASFADNLLYLLLEKPNT